jgi:hypothetical protein
MSQLAPHSLWVLGPGLLACAAGAVSIAVALHSARRPSAQPSRGPVAWFVTAALFAAMMAAFIYQGASNRFPPDYIGAAVFLVGAAIALGMGVRRLPPPAPRRPDHF